MQEPSVLNICPERGIPVLNLAREQQFEPFIGGKNQLSLNFQFSRVWVFLQVQAEFTSGPDLS